MQPADPPIPPPPPMPSRKRGRGQTKGDEPVPDEAAPPRKPSLPQASRSRRARSHVPPPLGVGGDGREEGVDFVSHLPDAVLGIIISLLPSKDGGKTRTLSKRWRPVWLTAPLNLDAGDLAPRADGAALAVLLTKILLAHAGPVRRFCIPVQQIHERPAMVEGWLTSPRFNNLEELEFTEDLCYMRQLLPLPPSIFRFSNTLRVAAFSQCRVPDCTDLMLQFPHLKLLSLRQVKISETSLHSIIAGCPALEGLLLRNSYGFRCLRINSPTIRSVAFHSPYCWSHGDGEVCYHLEDVIVEFAPCLEKLLHIERSVGLGVRVSVVVAPKLETLGVLDDVKDAVLDFGTVVFKGFKCGETNYWHRKYRKTIKSHNISLKTVVLDDYRGTNRQVQFATFFIQNASNLENMIFMGRPNKYNAYFIAQQPKLLEFEKRASETAHFHFRPKLCYNDWVHIKDVRARQEYFVDVLVSNLRVLMDVVTELKSYIDHVEDLS
uniref:Uncharacterized protein n=1 Tax=Oryza barthii TaxID=65489 RepID=A0A0D3GPJ8_9ORYZ